jgi:hypothetical protein
MLPKESWCIVIYKSMIIPIREILEVKPYYNIAVMLMVAKGKPQHAMKIFGEEGAFNQYREIQNWKNVIVASDHLSYPIGVNLSREILRPHYHVTACILAQRKDTACMTCNEPTPDFDESWLGDYPEKEKIIEFYKTIPQEFGI